MKKLFIIASLGVVLSAPSAFSQGYGIFSASARGVWDDFNQPFGKLGPTMDVAFLWGSGTPLISSIAPAVPTNAANIAMTFDVPTAWNDILNDANFHLAINANTSATAIATNFATGAWAYLSGAIFPVVGTTPGTYQFYAIGWDKTYATPQAAAAANAAVGWSAPFSYSMATQIGTPLNFSTSGFVPFGVIPEPGTLSFLALGAATLILRRIRNSK